MNVIKDKMEIKHWKIKLCVIIVISIFLFWQNNVLVISKYNYENEKVTESMDGFTIVQISDLHNKKIGQNYLIKKIESQHPDIIVITGDLIDSRYTKTDVSINFIKKAVKIAPIYYVTGNHEDWVKDEKEEDYKKLISSMETLGVVILENKTIEVNTGEDSSFYLTGVFDNDLNTNELHNITDNINKDKVSILLAHEPQFINRYSEENVDLVFSGHAHGGQIRLPIVGGLFSPEQGAFPKYTAGEYFVKDTTLVVSRGLGNSAFPFRIFNQPEIVVVTLKQMD